LERNAKTNFLETDFLMSTQILCVDDDPNILAGFQRNLRNLFALDVAPSGAEALRLLKERGPYAVIVADMRMPGMDGIQLLSEFMRQAPETVRIMLTGNAEQRTAVEAVNRGRVFRFLSKPCAPEDLIVALRSGLEQYRLIQAERTLLEQTLNGSVAMLMDVLSLVQPAASERGQERRAAMRAFAENLVVGSCWDLEMGAMLSQLGCVTLPPQVLLKRRSGLPLSTAENELILRIPELGAKLLAHIPRLEPVAQIVLYQAKRFDGTGFPQDAVGGQQIPIGSRILKVLDDLARLESQGLPKPRALKEMSHLKGWYDPDVMLAAYKFFDVSVPELALTPSKDVELFLDDIPTNALLLEDVMTSDGFLIVKANTVVSIPLLETLRNFALTSGLRQPLLLRVPIQSLEN
jgi:response regulator RpfG family c-di-GMP phosphodiesterase